MRVIRSNLIEKSHGGDPLPASDMTQKQSPEATSRRFRFIKGGADAYAALDSTAFNWRHQAEDTQSQVADAMSSRHLSFLLGSGCSSLYREGKELGIPTMAPLAKDFLAKEPKDDGYERPSEMEVESFKTILGVDIQAKEYSSNLERLMEVLYSTRFVAERSEAGDLKKCRPTVQQLIDKVVAYITKRCTNGEFSGGDDAVLNLYQAFYRRLALRDRHLPQPWIFTTNYDLFSETALDRIGVPYCNGFQGTVERRFNPSTFRYALAEQLDISAKRWVSVDGFLYLCKLHGSVNWQEDGRGLFPIREFSAGAAKSHRVMIYPTPTKQNSSFGAPYSDLFRQFQTRVAREQSVLVTIGYGFGDEHINNLIFQALTVPTFRLIAFIDPDTDGEVRKLRELEDPRVWIIGGDGESEGSKAHYFETIVEDFMPKAPGNAVETAVSKIVERLLSREEKKDTRSPDED